MRCNVRPRWLAAIPLILVVSCARPAGPSSTPSPRVIGQITEIPLPGSQYVYDLTVVDGLVWVTSQAGLYRVDPATGAAQNVLAHDYLYKIVSGHGFLVDLHGRHGTRAPHRSAVISDNRRDRPP